VFENYILVFPFSALYITETWTEAKHNLQRYIHTFNPDTLHSALSKQSIKIFYFLMQKAKVALIFCPVWDRSGISRQFSTFQRTKCDEKLKVFPLSIQSSVFSQKGARNIVEIEDWLKEMGFCLNQFSLVLSSTASDLITEILYRLISTSRLLHFMIPEGKKLLGRPRRRWRDNIKMDL